MPHVPPFTPDRRLFPFESRWFESRVGPVHYIDEGSGDPILLLHGNPTWSFLYRGIVIRLRKKFRCLALDYPGFGLSAHPDDYDFTPAEHAGVVRDFVREMGLTNLTIMGHDWGGPIGLAVARWELDRLRGLVMGNTWYWPAESFVAKAYSYVMSSAPMQSQILNRNFLVEKVMPWGVLHPLADEVLHHYREVLPTPTSRVGAAELPRQILEATAWLNELAADVRDKLANVPMLLVWGIHDFAFPRTYMERFREDFRLVKIKRLEAKHFIQEDAPGEIAVAVERFLAGGEAANG